MMASPSSRGDAKHRTRDLEIPGLVLTHHPGLTWLRMRREIPEFGHSMDLIADHISHRFGPLEVLDKVSFTGRSGEVVAIVGPSGCGKSTLVSILGGLLRPSAGAAELRGVPRPGSL